MKSTGNVSRRTVLTAAASLPFAGIKAGTAAESGRKTVTVICAYPAGALGDSTARIVAQTLSEAWKTPVIVENITGASGLIGAAQAARRPADGHTLLVLVPQTRSIALAAQSNLNFNPRDLIPLSLPCVTPVLMVVNSQSRFKTYKDLVDYAKANPGKVNFGHQGVGSSFHLAYEEWRLGLGLEMNTIPYAGGNPLVTDMLGNHLDAMFGVVSLVKSHLQSGRLRAIAVAEPQRLKEYPDVPTIAESGLPGFSTATELAVFIRASTPADIVKQLHADVIKAMKTAEGQKWLSDNAARASEETPEQLAARYDKETATYKSIIDRLKIKIGS